MAAKISFKRGDTFLIQCTLKQSGTIRALTGWTVKSQIRTQQMLRLVADLTFSVVDEQAGIFQLSCLSTSDWPVGILVCDIRYTMPTGQTVTTDTFNIEVQTGVTQ
jgi:hypothetical protein